MTTTATPVASLKRTGVARSGAARRHPHLNPQRRQTMWSLLGALAGAKARDDAAAGREYSVDVAPAAVSAGTPAALEWLAAFTTAFKPAGLPSQRRGLARLQESCESFSMPLGEGLAPDQPKSSLKSSSCASGILSAAGGREAYRSEPEAPPPATANLAKTTRGPRLSGAGQRRAPAKITTGGSRRIPEDPGVARVLNALLAHLECARSLPNGLQQDPRMTESTARGKGSRL